MGASFSNAGDVNGDGYDDFILGSSVPGTHTGKSYVIYGRPTNPDLNEIGLNNPLGAIDGFEIDGLSDNYAGESVSAAGDVSGDGLADLMIGATQAYG